MMHPAPAKATVTVVTTSSSPPTEDGHLAHHHHPAPPPPTINTATHTLTTTTTTSTSASASPTTIRHHQNSTSNNGSAKLSSLMTPTSPTTTLPTTTTTLTTANASATTPAAVFATFSARSGSAASTKVLSRPLSASQLQYNTTLKPVSSVSSLQQQQPRTASSIFSLASLGGGHSGSSPSSTFLTKSDSATSAAMTLSKSETLAFLASNAHSHVVPSPGMGSSSALLSPGGVTSSLTTASGAASLAAATLSGQNMTAASGTAGATTGTGYGGSILAHGQSQSSGGLPSYFHGIDTASLSELEDYQDLVMIDSNGNSAGSGICGSAMVGETTASAIVTSSGVTGGGGDGGGESGGVGATAAAAGGGTGNTFTMASSAAAAALSNAIPFQLATRSSLPSLTSQAKKDVMQRAAMLAMMQQNGGAKVLAAHRVGRRQDRPHRNIPFGEFHKICEIEYGFEKGKPLISNGRTLVHSTSVTRLEDGHRREEMIYIFSDVLVLGTKIGSRVKLPEQQQPTLSDEKLSLPEDDKEAAAAAAAAAAVLDEIEKSLQQMDASGQQSTETETVDAAIIRTDITNEANEVVENQDEGEEPTNTNTATSPKKNPYAGHLENQNIVRLIQVQADIEEDCVDDTLLKMTVPQSTFRLQFISKNARDGFLALLTETIQAHKHHLLFQSKYLADLKKFKRHSAFTFDTSFLKTWGIPGSNLLGGLTSPGGSATPPYLAGSGFGGGGLAGSSDDKNATITANNSSRMMMMDPFSTISRPQSITGSLYNFAMSGTDATASALESIWFLKDVAKGRRSQQQTNDNSSIRGSIYSVAGGLDRNTGGDTDSILSHPDQDESECGSLYHPGEESLGGESQYGGGGGHEEGMSESDIGQHSQQVSSSSQILYSNQYGPSRALGVSASRDSIVSNTSADWVRDEDATCCMVCRITKFGVLVRRHHCRVCGWIICYKCGQMRDGTVYGLPLEAKPIRVCLDCIDKEAQLTFIRQQQLQQQQNLVLQQQQQQQAAILANVGKNTGTVASGGSNSGNNNGTHLKPRKLLGARPASLHHRVSYYKIDVERVGEEDEEQEQEYNDEDEMIKKRKLAKEQLNNQVVKAPSSTLVISPLIKKSSMSPSSPTLAHSPRLQTSTLSHSVSIDSLVEEMGIHDVDNDATVKPLRKHKTLHRRQQPQHDEDEDEDEEEEQTMEELLAQQDQQQMEQMLAGR